MGVAADTAGCSMVIHTGSPHNAARRRMRVNGVQYVAVAPHAPGLGRTASRRGPMPTSRAAVKKKKFENTNRSIAFKWAGGPFRTAEACSRRLKNAGAPRGKRLPRNPSTPARSIHRRCSRCPRWHQLNPDLRGACRADASSRTSFCMDCWPRRELETLSTTS